MKLEKIISLNVKKYSFLEYLCFLRKEADYETSLSALSCFHGIIRLFTLVENVMNFGQRKNHAVPSTDEVISDSEKILKRGLVVSSQNELKCALNMFMDLVSSEWHLVQSSEVKDRGGPAPGIGLGWGATNGVFWSGKVLLAQADATVTTTLLELFPIVLDKDVFDQEKLNLQRDGILSLFHALGKVLHNKRHTDQITDSGQGSIFLEEKFVRYPLKMGVPEIVLSQEVSGNGTVQCSVLSRGCCRSPRIIWDPGIIPGFSWFS